MAKRKARTSAKPRSATKTRSKVKRAKPIHHNSRAKSKQAAVVALLNRPQEWPARNFSLAGSAIPDPNLPFDHRQ